MEKEPAREADIPHGGLKTAKHHYQMHMAAAGTAEKLRCSLLEHAMEKTISGLPPDMQTLARTHFYWSMVRDSVERQ
ncbi:MULTISPECIES: hypothetical protein [Neisseria]|uniref:Uncharacterized protein n=1 Tax=Neisseria musculi TaxID=1815583 RepID=A0A7H1M9G7_9NEIS|nr:MULTISPECIES: hypothetical protein [Neisseria]MBF0804355.1 hypothetical protein [Neisseria sp. 19428wB4_WF04]QNT58282.1 hypothetical protein H7A79_2668 [Neisseria musculi]TFU42885.1 hypothetical protein E4T99_08390 [Neisseria sp. WF04]